VEDEVLIIGGVEVIVVGDVQASWGSDKGGVELDDGESFGPDEFRVIAFGDDGEEAGFRLDVCTERTEEVRLCVDGGEVV